MILIFLNCNPIFAISENTPIKECSGKNNCFKVKLEVEESKKSFEKILKIINNTSRTKIVEVNEAYIHAEVKSKLMHFIDDLEVKLLPENNIIEVKSESRLGLIDFGVNKIRINELAYRLTTNQINN